MKAVTDMEAIRAVSVQINGAADILTNATTAGLCLVRNMVKHVTSAMEIFVLIVIKIIYVNTVPVIS